MMERKDSQILDQHGRPFQQKEAEEQQSEQPQIAGLHRTFSEHPSSGLSPEKAAQILLQAEQGDLISQCELAEDLEEKDGHLYAELDKRKRALLSVDWYLEPPRDASEAEKQDTKIVQAMLEDLNVMPTLLKDMADAILKGFSMHELKWQREGSTWFVESPEYRDPSWFITHPDRRNELRLRDSTHEGAELWPFGWLKHEHKAKSGYLSRAGLVRQLVWPFIFKNYSVRDLAEFLEIYGLPLRIGKYPSGANDGEKRALLQAVMSIGHNAGGIMPKGMEMDFHSAANGQAEPFELMMSWGEKTMSKVILGGTLTSQADGKSSTNALGNVHNEVREELRDSDLEQLATSLSRDLIYPMYALNCKSFKNRRRYPKFVFDIKKPEDLQALAAPLKSLVELGLRVPEKWVHEKGRIPEAAEGEAVLTLAAPKQPAPPMPTKTLTAEEAKAETALAALAAGDVSKAAKSKTDLDIADVFAVQLKHSMSPVLKSYIAQIQQIVEHADSLESIAEALTKLDLPIEEATTVMQMAFVAAELAGQNDVEEDA